LAAGTVPAAQCENEGNAMSAESTAIVRAAEALVDALIDWREAHPDMCDAAAKGTRSALDMANHLRAVYDDDED
jgi:hypothetical protein